MQNFPDAAGILWTKSFVGFEYNFLFDSDIEKESNVNPSFVFRQMSVHGDLFWQTKFF